MSPLVARSMLAALLASIVGLIRKLRRFRSLWARERAAALGKCPTCRDPIPGLDPVETRPRPWVYCEACRAEDRARKRAEA